VNEMTSISKMSAQNYMYLLVAALLVAIVLQFVVSTAGALLFDVERFYAANKLTADKIAQDIESLKEEGLSPEKSFSEIQFSPEQRKKLVSINDNFQTLWFGQDSAATKLTLFGVLTVPWINTKPKLGNLEPHRNLAEMERDLGAYRNDRRFVVD